VKSLFLCRPARLGAAYMVQDLLALPVMNVGPATFACGERAGRQEREEFSHNLTGLSVAPTGGALSPVLLSQSTVTHFLL